MIEFYVDLHVHIGCDSQGRRVKVSGSKRLTFENIAKECFYKRCGCSRNCGQLLLCNQ